MGTKNRNTKKTKSLIRLFENIKVTDKQQNKEELIQLFPYKKLLKIVLKYVYDPFICYNFNNSELNSIFSGIPYKKSMQDSDIRLKKFFKFIKNAADRRIISSDYDKLKEILQLTTKNERTLLENIIKKDLNIGLSGYLINKLFPKMIIYPTRFMTCLSYNPEYQIAFPVLIEPKEHGIRVKIVCDRDGKFFAYTRNFQNVTSMFNSYKIPLLKISEKKDSKIELEGILFYKNIKETVDLIKNIVSYKISTIPNDYTFRLIDFVVDRNRKMDLRLRKNDVVKTAAILLKNGITQISIIPFIEVIDKYKIFKACNKSIENGNKGIILKDPKSPYVYNCDSRWLSYENPMYERGEIIEILRDRTDLNKCRCIVIRNKEGIEKMVTNISKVLQTNIWKDRTKIIGLSCMIEKGIQQNRLHKIYYYKGINL